jgi:glyoxylase-like metal-dependent hydrolase (beta-lactamase superfamily II)
MGNTELVEVANGIFVCLQPDGSWGLSNAGLIAGKKEQLLVDTFFDLSRTDEMLTQLNRVSPVDPASTVVVNTHTNGDHCYGNIRFSNSRIIASAKARLELLEMPAAKLHKLMTVARFLSRVGGGRRVIRSLLAKLGMAVGVDFIDAVPYVLSAFEAFDFSNIPLVPPNETFEGTLELELDGRQLMLLELGPAHTEGDVIAFDPKTKTLFSGDLLFMGCHPLAWTGTTESSIAALTRLLELEPDVVVPGHGPLTNRAGIEEHIAYFRALRDEVTPHFFSGATAEQVARKLMEKGFGSRALPERLFVNIEAVYRELEPGRSRVNVIRAMGAMSRLAGMA